MQIAGATSRSVSGEEKAHRCLQFPCNCARNRDPLYLFACHLEWKHNPTVEVYQELVAALDDPKEEVRVVAECLLQRSSPRPRGMKLGKK
jgi:hypothetical protein